ncbi:hypothetical protein R3P38DRAFT_3431529 [Favolaschia claudopus]|uniref:Uncharacterized protein n=1 Tax=Favolaschia claudopus TaxID=2862362 RepID=A0AAW0CVR0_9AGAR
MPLHAQADADTSEELEADEFGRGYGGVGLEGRSQRKRGFGRRQDDERKCIICIQKMRLDANGLRRTCEKPILEAVGLKARVSSAPPPRIEERKTLRGGAGPFVSPVTAMRDSEHLMHEEYTDGMPHAIDNRQTGERDSGYRARKGQGKDEVRSRASVNIWSRVRENQRSSVIHGCELLGQCGADGRRKEAEKNDFDHTASERYMEAGEKAATRL